MSGSEGERDIVRELRDIAGHAGHDFDAIERETIWKAAALLEESLRRPPVREGGEGEVARASEGAPHPDEPLITGKPYWRTMESAPKDGSEIIIASWGGTSDGELFLWWAEETFWQAEGCWHLTRERQGAHTGSFPATHWTQLIKPGAAIAGAEQVRSEAEPPLSPVSREVVIEECAQEALRVGSQFAGAAERRGCRKVAQRLRALSRALPGRTEGGEATRPDDGPTAPTEPETKGRTAQ